MTSILTWLTGTVTSTTNSSPSGKLQSAGMKAETSKTIVQKEIITDNDDEDWVLFEDLQNRKVLGLATNPTPPGSLPQGTSKYSAQTTTSTQQSLSKHGNINSQSAENATGIDSKPLVMQAEMQLEDDIDQTSSIATIEHVRVSSPTISPSIPPPQTDNLSTLLALVASATAAKADDRQSLKSQPRTLQTLAQIKDQELKMKKMKKMAYRK